MSELFNKYLEKSESILWEKEFPSKNLLFNKKKYNKYLKLIFSILVPISIFLIFFTLVIAENWYYKYIPTIVIVLIFLLLPTLFILMSYKEDKKIYRNMSKIYPDELLRKYNPFYRITNKNIVIRGYEQWEYKFDNDYNEKIKHFARYEKDFLILNHKFLEKAIVFKFSKLFTIGLYFYTSDEIFKKKIEYLIEDLRLLESTKAIKTLQDVRNNLLVKYRSHQMHLYLLWLVFIPLVVFLYFQFLF